MKRSGPGWLPGVLLGAGVVAAIALAVAGLTGIALVSSYRPIPPGGPFGDPSLDSMVGMIHLHEWSLAAAVLASAMAAIFMTVRVLVERPRCGFLAATAAFVAAASAVVGWATWPLVAWDQVAFVAVVVGTGLRGLWFPAFDDGIAFVMVNSAEVDQGTYRRWLLVHLAAPLVGLVALGLAMRARRSRPIQGLGAEPLARR